MPLCGPTLSEVPAPAYNLVHDPKVTNHSLDGYERGCALLSEDTLVLSKKGFLFPEQISDSGQSPTHRPNVRFRGQLPIELKPQ